MKPTQALHGAGQSIWLDNITRALLDEGTGQRDPAVLGRACRVGLTAAGHPAWPRPAAPGSRHRPDPGPRGTNTEYKQRKELMTCS
jgi:hypothetical protein